MSTIVENVVEFNQRVLKIDQRVVGFIDEAEFHISVECEKEEIDEFYYAYKSGNLIGCIDAQIDLIYFAFGVLYKFGLTTEQIGKCFIAVHEANMEKKLGSNAKRGDGRVADAVKPENWISPEERIAKIISGDDE